MGPFSTLYFIQVMSIHKSQLVLTYRLQLSLPTAGVILFNCNLHTRHNVTQIDQCLYVVFVVIPIAANLMFKTAGVLAHQTNMGLKMGKLNFPEKNIFKKWMQNSAKVQPTSEIHFSTKKSQRENERDEHRRLKE